MNYEQAYQWLHGDRVEYSGCPASEAERGVNRARVTKLTERAVPAALRLNNLLAGGLKSEDRQMKYRKKPVVIEATQWFKHGDHPAVVKQHATDPDTVGWVQTLEGGHIVTSGDWIITGIKGEHYPCKPDIFTATYELAE